MASHHIEFSCPVRVSDVLIYFAKELGADYTGYAGTGHDARDEQGNTLLELFNSDNRVLYYVNPHAGFLPTIKKELTRKVSIENVHGAIIDDEYLALLTGGLEELQA